jgi:hypothetical protein
MIKTNFSVLLILLLLTSCRSPSYVSTAYHKVDGASESDSSKDDDRVVIFNATIRISVESADSLNRTLVELSKKYEGYAVSLGNKKSTIRVAAKNLNKALAELSKAGKIKSKVLSGDDVTDEYRDYTLRLENASKARERYLELLARAENVEAALKVEKELERLNLETEDLKGKINRLKHLSDFSTIDVTIDERHKLGLLGYVGKGIYEGIKWLIVRD